ncbi:MAG: hypothetical protein E7107_05380 [Prevotella sp.]|nr:hypothetical protein [Prevotella sp.]
MKRFLQNRIAESKLTLPLTMTYAAVVWLLSGLFTGQWWIQFACFVLAAFLMMEMNAIHALIRIYSRMVSCVFVVLLCVACFLFPSLQGAITQVCFIAALTLLFNSYQDKTSAGWTYYGFLAIGIITLTFVHMLFFVPILWLVMTFQLQSFSWRTWAASLVGIVTPYWFWSCWLAWNADFTPLAEHLAPLGDFCLPLDFSQYTSHHFVTLAFVVLMAIVGTIHYIRKHHDDKIRVRLLYGAFMWMSLTSTLFILLQPQHYDALIRILIINTAPLLGHFLALTRTRQTNVAFFVITAAAILITGYNLWM